MQPQHVLAVDHFRNTVGLFEQTMQWLRAETGSTTHCQMERALRDRGFELMRVMYQGWLDQRSFEERQQAAGEKSAPGVEVRGFGRNIECDFGRVRLSQLGYQRAGQATEFPLDRELNLPEES